MSAQGSGRVSGTPGSRAAGRPTLRVDPVACDGIGQCALAAPGLIGLDRWGYPELPSGLSGRDVGAAARAVAACPRRALWLEDDEAGARGRAAG